MGAVRFPLFFVMKLPKNTQKYGHKVHVGSCLIFVFLLPDSTELCSVPLLFFLFNSTSTLYQSVPGCFSATDWHNISSCSVAQHPFEFEPLSLLCQGAFMSL